MVVDDGDGEVEVVPETIGVICERVDVFGAIWIELRFGVELN